MAYSKGIGCYSFPPSELRALKVSYIRRRRRRSLTALASIYARTLLLVLSLSRSCCWRGHCVRRPSVRLSELVCLYLKRKKKTTATNSCWPVAVSVSYF